MKKGWVLFVVALAALAACSSADKGEACEDEGTVGGDCVEGLMCARSKTDETSPLQCLTPCESDTSCGPTENCNGDRGRNLKVCRPR